MESDGGGGEQCMTVDSGTFYQVRREKTGKHIDVSGTHNRFRTPHIRINACRSFVQLTYIREAWGACVWTWIGSRTEWRRPRTDWHSQFGQTINIPFSCFLQNTLWPGPDRYSRDREQWSRCVRVFIVCTVNNDGAVCFIMDIEQ